MASEVGSHDQEIGMTDSGAFKGFSKLTIKFFRDLADHNNRAWFEDHREVYESAVMAPSRAFVEAMGARLKPEIPGIVAVPKVNKSIFKINRDTRFSLDPSPYKTNMGLYLWEGPRPRLESAGFYFHLEPPDLMIGGGMYVFPDPVLEKFRRAAVHPRHGRELTVIVKDLTAAGYELGGRHYKRVPPGFDAGHPNAALLLHKGLYTGWEGKIPPEFFSGTLIDFCYAKFAPIIPLHRWLMKTLAYS
jgi:uncharacterized protein (TIGR02453 family)